MNQPMERASISMRRVQLLQMSASTRGAGWVALCLRELSKKSWKFDVETFELHEVPSLSDDALTVNFVGLDPARDLAVVADLLQRQHSPRAISFISNSSLTPDAMGLLLESGAVAQIRSLESTKLAARAIDRFFECWPLSTNGPMLQQLPWSQFASLRTS